MKTYLSTDTAAPLPKAHTIRLHFSDSPEDQALYAALNASSEREHRTPLTRQTKCMLRMAMGLMRPDLCLLKRMGITAFDEFDIGNGAAAHGPTARPALRLIQGGPDGQPSL
ncbi:MAG: hypothetical protein Q8L77_14545 [Nitrospirota bacterium]|nr:hypothetical protein [Nitrospirota bacterium]